MMISKIEFKYFQKQIDVGIFCVFKVGIIRITFKFLFIRSKFLFKKNLIPNFW
jgi:hypothetical protein